jgi:hypothetical protein
MSTLATIICTVVFFASFIAVFWVRAYFESRTYNRLTGAHTTTWDALWVELRVQEGTK